MALVEDDSQDAADSFWEVATYCVNGLTEAVSAPRRIQVGCLRHENVATLIRPPQRSIGTSFVCISKRLFWGFVQRRLSQLADKGCKLGAVRVAGKELVADVQGES